MSPQTPEPALIPQTDSNSPFVGPKNAKKKNNPDSSRRELNFTEILVAPFKTSNCREPPQRQRVALSEDESLSLIRVWWMLKQQSEKDPLGNAAKLMMVSHATQLGLLLAGTPSEKSGSEGWEMQKDVFIP